MTSRAFRKLSFSTLLEEEERKKAFRESSVHTVYCIYTCTVYICIHIHICMHMGNIPEFIYNVQKQLTDVYGSFHSLI